MISCWSFSKPKNGRGECEPKRLLFTEERCDEQTPASAAPLLGVGCRRVVRLLANLPTYRFLFEHSPSNFQDPKSHYDQSVYIATILPTAVPMSATAAAIAYTKPGRIRAAVTHTLIAEATNGSINASPASRSVRAAVYV
jgi:hypothetical protein